MAEIADDAIAFIRTLGFTEVDLVGFSLGGFVAQDIVLKAPNLIRARLFWRALGPQEVKV